LEIRNHNAAAIPRKVVWQLLYMKVSAMYCTNAICPPVMGMISSNFSVYDEDDQMFPNYEYAQNSYEKIGQNREKRKGDCYF